MSAEKYLQMIQQDIHSVVFATIDENQFPVTCVLDIMLADKDGLYFLTAKGKAFYERLQNQPVISITGMIGNDTLSSKSVTLRGEVWEIGQGLLSEIFEKNSYMKAIYPNAASRTALTVFQIYKGSGEFFDLSQKPIIFLAVMFCIQSVRLSMEKSRKKIATCYQTVTVPVLNLPQSIS